MTSKHEDPYLYCRRILPRVSRTFALNISVLTGELQRAVLCAYLFCRVVDTVEDTPGLDPARQDELLARYAALFAGDDVTEATVQNWIALWSAETEVNDEIDLVQNAGKVFAAYRPLPESVRQAIRACVSEMSLGMKQTLAAPIDAASGLHLLCSLEDLNQYCYYVAGTVGRMLTALFCHYSPEINESTRTAMTARDKSFARGLQLTNIIKDCRRDIERGWCYIPANLMRAQGVSPAQFFAAESRAGAVHVLNQLIAIAAEDLKAALDYTLLIPANRRRLRLFNLWSLFFAAHTLASAWNNHRLFDPAHQVKISRSRVYWTMFTSYARCSHPERLRKSLSRILRPIQSLRV